MHLLCTLQGLALFFFNQEDENTQMRDNPDSSYLSVWRLTDEAGEAGIVVVADYLLSSLISSVRFHAALTNTRTHSQSSSVKWTNFKYDLSEIQCSEKRRFKIFIISPLAGDEIMVSLARTNHPTVQSELRLPIVWHVTMMKQHLLHHLNNLN